MRAAQYYGPGDIRIEEIPDPEPGPGQVKIKIAWNGICGSDLHFWSVPIERFAALLEGMGEGGMKLPITPGHEASGTIVSLGQGVDDSKWKVGQNVAVEPVITCEEETCPTCRTGSRNLCRQTRFIGTFNSSGGLSEYVALDTKHLHLLPDHVPLDVGACIEPLSVAWHAVKISRFTPGRAVLIVGAGTIGICILRVLKAFDSSVMTIVSEPSAVRRELASRSGATIVLDPTQVDVGKEALAATSQRGGVDIAFDAAGVAAGFTTAIQSLRPRGTLVNVSIWEAPAQFDMNIVVTKELSVIGSFAYDRVHPDVIQAVADGRIADVESLITGRVKLEDVVEKGFLALLDKDVAHVKILVHP